MSLEFFDLLELREHWHELHRIGDTPGLAKAEELAGIRHTAAETRERTRELAKLPESVRQSLLLPEREWEAKLAIAALAEDFSIERVTLALDPGLVQRFRDQLIEALGRPAPWGGILYFESAGEHALRDGKWHAHLYLALASGRQPIELHLESWAGVTQVQGSERIA